LSKCLIIDDNPQNLVNQLSNSIPIIPFRGLKDKGDTQLIKLASYLELLKESSTNDIVKKNGEHFGLERMRDATNLQEAYDLLFRKKYVI